MSDRMSRAVLEFDTEDASFFRSMDRAIKKAGGLQGAMDSSGKGLQRFGGQLDGLGKRLTLGITTPILGVVAASVKLGTDAGENANKFNVVMGSAADSAREKLEALKDVVPLTTGELQGMAAGIQDLLVPMGVSRTEAAGMSVDMVALAADLGSFNNVGTDQVLQDIQSALAGSSEPMQKYGVDTRVANLEAVALANGLIQQGEELDRTARAQAVLLAIQQGSTDAMGDAARTADDFANSTRLLWRDVRQLGEGLGQALIPTLEPLVIKGREWVAWLKELSPEQKRLAAGVTAAAAAGGPLLIVLGQMSMGLGAILRVTAPVVGGIVKLSGSLSKSLGIISRATSMLGLRGGLAMALRIVGSALTGPVGITVMVGSALLAFKPLRDVLKQTGANAIEFGKRSVEAGQGAVRAFRDVSKWTLDAGRKAIDATPAAENLARSWALMKGALGWVKTAGSDLLNWLDETKQTNLRALESFLNLEEGTLKTGSILGITTSIVANYGKTSDAAAVSSERLATGVTRIGGGVKKTAPSFREFVAENANWVLHQRALLDQADAILDHLSRRATALERMVEFQTAWNTALGLTNRELELHTERQQFVEEFYTSGMPTGLKELAERIRITSGEHDAFTRVMSQGVVVTNTTAIPSLAAYEELMQSLGITTTTTGDAIEETLGQKIAGAFKGAFNVDALKGIATNAIGTIFTDGLSGAVGVVQTGLTTMLSMAMNGIIPGLGVLAAPLVDALANLFGSIFKGKTQAEDIAKQFGLALDAELMSKIRELGDAHGRDYGLAIVLSMNEVIAQNRPTTMAEFEKLEQMVWDVFSFADRGEIPWQRALDAFAQNLPALIAQLDSAGGSAMDLQDRFSNLLTLASSGVLDLEQVVVVITAAVRQMADAGVEGVQELVGWLATLGVEIEGVTLSMEDLETKADEVKAAYDDWKEAEQTLADLEAELEALKNKTEDVAEAGKQAMSSWLSDLGVDTSVTFKQIHEKYALLQERMGLSDEVTAKLRRAELKKLRDDTRAILEQMADDSNMTEAEKAEFVKAGMKAAREERRETARAARQAVQEEARDARQSLQQQIRDARKVEREKRTLFKETMRQIKAMFLDMGLAWSQTIQQMILDGESFEDEMVGNSVFPDTATGAERSFDAIDTAGADTFARLGKLATLSLPHGPDAVLGRGEASRFTDTLANAFVSRPVVTSARVVSTAGSGIDPELAEAIHGLRRDLHSSLPIIVEKAARHGAQTAGRRLG